MIDTTTRQADAITPEFAAEAQELISHYPVSKRSASLPLLHLWQNHFGFIDDTGIEWIAAQLDLTPVNILELVTFYPWFRREFVPPRAFDAIIDANGSRALMDEIALNR